MGVPKFYRWISERYPCLSEVVKENQIPEFDNLYLDMNGIIHPCSHPNDEDVHFRITEEQIFEAIFHYIEVLFRIIKPRKVFFMAVDGVAPRAKMNQQRGRRFRSAREAEEREKEAVAKGEVLPAAKRFDSNCITPGTPFMVRLHEQLKYFVRQKMSKDPMWQGLTVYLSGHETPGEGEHKIMDFIRSERARKDYDANTRHCLYGLDADLIMLGLISHDPHFSLLREEVRFGKIANQKRPTTPEETTFHLLHLSLMREYLEVEFSALKPQIDWFDLERIIDDWVLMGYLVGNDFIPHLPDMHISHNALPMLYKTYIEVLPSLGGYLNEHGTLNLPRFEKYLTHLSKFDREKFEQTFSDLSFFAGKTDIRAWKSERAQSKKEAEKQRRVAKANSNQFSMLDNFGDVMGFKPAAGSKVTGQSSAFSQDSFVEEDGDTFEEEFIAHKRAYYDDKFEMENITDEQRSVIVYNYILAIQWILDYYYNGIQSWGWYYPYHYAPYMSDLQGFSNANLKYDKGQPFLPFQQLLGVLPAASRDLLPEPYQKLMTMDNSPIMDYYPLDFATDLNGKLQQWEAVVLIPFIDEKRLLAAMENVSKYLTDEERSRNRHGPHLMHKYEETLNYKYPSSLPGHFPDINACRVSCQELDKGIFHLDPRQLRRGLCSGTKTGVYFPGFPTLHHLRFSTQLRKDEIKVFQQNSRGESTILSIETENADVEAGDVANEVIGKNCFAEWPHLKEVKVVAVADDITRYELVESKQKNPDEAGTPVVKRRDMSDYDAAVWVKDIKAIQERYHKRKGVLIGPSYVLVYACPLMGRRYVSGHGGVVTLEKQWSSTPVAYVYQMMVKDIAVHDSTFKQFKTLEEVYPKHSHCFMLGAPNYGCQGSVVDVEAGRVRVLLSCPVQPNLNQLRNSQSSYEVQYMSAHILAQRLGMTSLIVSRLTGSIFVGRGSKHSSSVAPSNNFNIGLNLKFNKSNQEVQGYSKKDETGTWLYSNKVLDVIKDYMNKFPEVFRHISQNARADTFFEDNLFDGQAGRMKELQDFIRALPCAKVSKVDVGLKNLDEPVIKLIEAEVQKVSGLKVKKQKLSVKPHVLYKPLHYLGNLIPDPQVEHELFDRVINVREGYTVPLGLRGVIIGIQPGETVLDYIYEVIFDEEFPGGLVIRCTGTRGYRLPTTAIINTSFGLRKEQSLQQSHKPMAVVKPQVFPQPTAQTQSRGWYSDTIGRLGASQQQQRLQQQQQQQQQQQRQPQAQVPCKSTAAINYKAALVQASSSKPPKESSPVAQPSPAMQILAKTTPRMVARSPVKESGPRKGPSPKNIPPRLQSKEDLQSKRNAAQECRRGSGTIPQLVSSTRPASESQSREESNATKSQLIKTAKQGPDNEADEFALMWRNLQKTSYSGTSSPVTDKGNSPSDELTSPSASGGQTPLSEEDVVRPSLQMRLALSALPKVEAPGSTVTEEETNPDGGDEKECEGGEVEDEAQMAARTTVKSGTEELCRMLNITSMSDDTGPPKDMAVPHSVVIEPSTGKKQYGIRVSVDQLFAGASVRTASPNASHAPLTPTSPASVPTVPHDGAQPTAFKPHPMTQRSGPVYGPHPGGVQTPVSVQPNATSDQPRYIDGRQPQGLAPQGLAPQGLAPQGLAPQGLAPQGLAPQGLAPQGLAPQGLAPQGLAPQGLAPQGLAPRSSDPSLIPGPVPAPKPPGQVGMSGLSGMVLVMQGQGPQMSPSSVPQGAAPSGRFLAGIYPTQPLGSPGQHLPGNRPQCSPLIAVTSGHQSISYPSSHIVQPGHKPMQQQQQPQPQAQQQGTAPQPQLGVQQLTPQPIGIHSPASQLPASMVKPAPRQMDPQPAEHPHHKPASVGPNVNTSNTNQYPAPVAQQVGMGASQATPPGLSAFKPGLIQAPIELRSQQQQQQQPQHGVGMMTSPGRPHTGPHAMGSPSQPPNVRPKASLQAPQQGHPVPLGFPPRTQSPSQALLMWTQHRGLPRPLYHVQKNNTTGLFRAIVQIAKGFQFFGPDSLKDAGAVDAVAHIAMTSLTSQSPRGPAVQQMRPTTRPTLGPVHGPMIHATGPNPFVPLQVTKQLNSPQRSSSSEADLSPGRTLPEQQMEYPVHDAPPSARVDQSARDQSASAVESTLSSRRELDFGGSALERDSPVTEVVESVGPRKSSIDETSGAVISERRPSVGAAAKRRRASSKAKLAINFGGK